MPKIRAHDWEERERKAIAASLKAATRHTLSAGGVTIEVIEYKPDELLKVQEGQKSCAIRKASARDYVVLHWTAGLGTNPEWFVKTRFTVAYYVGVTGVIFKYFDDTKYVSDHAANGWVNNASIGIELASPGLLYTGPHHGKGEPKEWMYHEAAKSKDGSDGCIYCKASDTHLYKKIGDKYYALFTKAQTEATVQLVKYLCKKHNIPPNILPEDKRGKNIPKQEIKAYRGILTHWNCVGPTGHSDELLQFDWALLKYALEANEWQPSGAGAPPPKTDAKSESEKIPKSPPAPKESPSKPKSSPGDAKQKPSDPPSGAQQVTFHVGDKPGDVGVSVKVNEAPPPGEDKPMSAPQAETQLRERAVKLAEGLLDTPYIWGGDNPRKGLDCSGLIVYIFNTLGILKGDTTAQGLRKKWKEGGNDPGSAKPGDLIYYGKEEKATHVTMYVGDEMCIGANGGGPACTTPEIALKKNAKVKRVKWNYRKDYLGFAPIPPLDEPDKKPLPKEEAPLLTGDAAGKAVADRAAAFVAAHAKDGEEPIAYNPDMTDDDPGGGSIAPYGFVSWIYGRAGVALPHASYKKWIEKATRRGQTAFRTQAKAGDIAMLPDQAAIYVSDGKWAALSKEKGAGLYPLEELEAEAGPLTQIIRPWGPKSDPPPETAKRYDDYRKAVETYYAGTWKDDPMQMNVIGVSGYRAGQRVPNVAGVFNDTIAICYKDTDGHKFCSEFLATVDPPNGEADKPEKHLEYGQYSFKKGKVKDPESGEEYDGFVPEGQLRVWEDDGDGARHHDTPVETGDFPLHLMAGGLSEKVPQKSQGSQLIWGGTKLGSPWSFFYDIAKRDPDGSFAYTLLDSDQMPDVKPPPAPQQQAGPSGSAGGAEMPEGPFGSLTYLFRGKTLLTYDFTAEDVLWVARLVTGEAGGKDDPDNRAVLWTMFNRFAFFTHKVYKSFHKFIRAYSTPLQPSLNSWGTAKRHQNNPDFVETGGTYEDKGHPEVKRGQLGKFLKLQKTPWSKLPAGARSLAKNAMAGAVPNPVRNASEFANTATYYQDKNGKRPETREAWLEFTLDFAKKKKWAWIGDVEGLDQIKENAFFADQRRVGGDASAPRFPEVAEPLVRIAVGQAPAPQQTYEDPAPPLVEVPIGEEPDPLIEKLDLEEVARKAAYALKREHPTVKFTSGRRNKGDQARAMAQNVMQNPKWIEQTYSDTKASRACQKWVDDHTQNGKLTVTQREVEDGLLGVVNSLTDAEVGKLSKHLSGMAFDVQPVTENAEAIKKTLDSLEGKDRFLEKEGGLVRWHIQFK